MPTMIDVADVLAPIAGENPAGEDLRYDAVYEEIKEARKADDQLDRGDWQRDLKSADWQTVVKLSAETLSLRSKDLQLAVWLTEGLVKTIGFSGLSKGLQVINGLLQDFWSSFYPLIEDGDLDFRSGRLAFLNDKLWLSIKHIPLTDKSKTSEYSWLDWHESRQIGYEKDTVSADGDVDEKKQERRNAAIAEGKVAPEEFDNALAVTPENFSRSQFNSLQECQEEFGRLDDIIDERFGNEGPSLAQLKETLDDCEQFFRRLFKGKGWAMDTEENNSSADSAEETVEPELSEAPDEESLPGTEETLSAAPPQVVPKTIVAASDAAENSVWERAVGLLRGKDLDAALALLFDASCSALSTRQKNRYRLYMAKLCLKANRVDLAKPILEELNTLIEELQLERWESPTWVGEVLEALYLCLTASDERFHDPDRAEELLKKLCTTDVTKAMNYKS